jgi:hypothetical protein
VGKPLVDVEVEDVSGMLTLETDLTSITPWSSV